MTRTDLSSVSLPCSFQPLKRRSYTHARDAPQAGSTNMRWSSERKRPTFSTRNNNTLWNASASCPEKWQTKKQHRFQVLLSSTLRTRFPPKFWFTCKIRYWSNQEPYFFMTAATRTTCLHSPRRWIDKKKENNWERNASSRVPSDFGFTARSSVFLLL